MFFGHAYKGQRDGVALLRRFAAGGGALLDLEYLADDGGRRLAAFGYWAGYAGAALAVLHHRGRLAAPLHPLRRSQLDGLLREPAAAVPRVLVIGALGRCGRGACDALRTAGIEPTRWDIDETRSIDRQALLGHDILVNAVLAGPATPPFLTRAALRRGARRLAIVADVACDVSSARNVLPIYDRGTSWQEPVLRLTGGGQPLDVIAIDNLPSLLPAEASAAFSADLAPLLLSLGDTPAWRRCLRAFREACETNGVDAGFTHA